MGLFNSAAGTVRLKIISADPIDILRQLNQAEIAIFDVHMTDELSAVLSIYRSDLQNANKIVKKNNGQIYIIKFIGAYWKLKSIFIRPVLLAGILALIAVVFFLTSRIFFFEVEGNAQLPDRLILEKAKECGISFGTPRRIVRSEKMKNALIAEIPELQWAGINTSGCVATISVKEKEPAMVSSDESVGANSIVASRDGVIVSYIVLKGNALCKVGQAVKAGQTLVSGYIDHGMVIHVTPAKAEILAKTYRTQRVMTPANRAIRGRNTHIETRYSLLVGKKLINFYKDSGISDAGCVKMYSENYLTLPGGFELPIALVVEQLSFYETENVSVTLMDDYSWLKEYAEEHLLNSMVAGQIVSKSDFLKITDDICCLDGKYSCLEMISQVKNEVNIHSYGENYGENR